MKVWVNCGKPTNQVSKQTTHHENHQYHHHLSAFSFRHSLLFILQEKKKSTVIRNADADHLTSREALLRQLPAKQLPQQWYIEHS